jgi:hypothetical protein
MQPGSWLEHLRAKRSNGEAIAMKPYFGRGLVLIFLCSSVFVVRGEEKTNHIKSGCMINQIYTEPLGARAAQRPTYLISASTPEDSLISVHPGWPKTFKYRDLGYGFGCPGPARMIASDLDGDGKGEIVVAPEYWNKGLIFRENGELVNNFFLPNVSQETLSVGDIDRNKKNEIVTMSYPGGIKLFLNVFNWLGNLLYDKNLSPDLSPFLPVLADLNNDRQDEIIFKTGYNQKQSKLMILDGKGHIISEVITRIAENTNSFFNTAPVIGNFDDDADLEVALPLWHYEDEENRRTGIEVYDLDGTPVPGWGNVSYPDFLYNPVCGDLDGDGRDEIIACSWEENLLIFAGDGRLILDKEFPNGLISGSPAVGDINGDGKPEIVFNMFNYNGPASLLAIDPQGEIILEKSISNESYFSPLVADMDGDGVPDIVFGNGDYIYAFNWQGKDIGGFPIRVNAKNCGLRYGPGPSICDIDLDGRIEITYTKDDADAHEFSLNVLDVDSPYSPGTMEWPMHQHDTGHSGRYVSQLKNLLNLDLLAERREARAFSILRQYGRIQFPGMNSDVPVARYRIMRCRGNGDFETIRTITPSELQNNQFQMLDMYLEKDIPYTYRVTACDAAGKVVGLSLGKTI